MAKRFLYFVRHGQYDAAAPCDDLLGNGLSPLGKRQAKRTAKALAHVPISTIHYSTMRRAEETTEPFLEHFSNARPHRTQRLWEAIPCLPLRHSEYFINHHTPIQLQYQAERAEKAYEYYFKRAHGEDKHEVLVSHGNLIRYFVCRAMGADPGAWLGMDSYNCGITRIIVNEDGFCSVLSYNDVGHLPPELRTDNFHPI